MSIDCEILLVGAGLSGIGMSIQLRRHGFNDFLILEKAEDVGGTWRDNSYPGCTVDIPTLYYSFSYERRTHWSTFYAPQRELHEYCRELTEKHQIRDRIRFGEEVKFARYDEATNVWVTETTGGRVYRSRYLISATGLFGATRWPDIPGLNDFKGAVMHSTAWDHGYDFGGKRAAIIGTGATGVQIIPELAERAGHLDVYQRTPTWVLPKPDKPISHRLRWLMETLPGFHWVFRQAVVAAVDVPLFGIFHAFRRNRWISYALRRMARRHLERSVPDPDMRAKLTPSFDFGCRRPTFSNVYYPAFGRSDVELVTEPIDRFTQTSIITKDGKERPLDVLVLATGFRVFERHTNPTFPVYGVSGEDLSDSWERHGPQAFKAVSVNGFPNFFLVYGPYSTVSLSYIAMIENSVTHIIRVLREARHRGSHRVEVKAEAQAKDLRWSERHARNAIWFKGNCVGAGAARGNHKNNPGIRPSNAFASWLEVRTFGLSSYTFKRFSPRMADAQPVVQHK